MIRTQVALGIDTFDGIVWTGVDYLADETGSDVSDPEVIGRVWQITDEQFTEHLAAQTSWPAITDSDRLTGAFRDLDLAGIVAREVFTCCQNCGNAEIGDEFSRGQKPRGFVFYHEQDAERGVDGEGVYLAYNGFDQAAIGAEVVAALRRRGLQPQWNGSTATRILLPLSWQRRRTGPLAAHPSAIHGDDFTIRVEPMDGWSGPQPIAGGSTSAKAWAALRLPWLPTGRSVRLSCANQAALTVFREWDQLVGAYIGPGNTEEIIAPRTDPWALLSRLRDHEPAASAIGQQEPMLEVAFDHSAARSDGTIPLTLPECLAMLSTMPVRTGGWTTYTSRSGAVVQHIWQDGPQLWMEYLDQSQRASHGRQVTIAQAGQVITTLAERDRIILDEFGDLTTKSW